MHHTLWDVQMAEMNFQTRSSVINFKRFNQEILPYCNYAAI
ncbi:DUF6783 domain-containing protein [Robinsoniella peoriensis]